MNKNEVISKIRRNLNMNGAKKAAYFVLSPMIRRIRAFNIRIIAKKSQSHYSEIIRNINSANRTILNFAAYVIFDSTYGMDGVFKLMMNNPDHWNPKIVIIPDVARGREHAIETYKKSKEYFVNRYGEECVLDGWIPENDEYIDPIDCFDIVYYANPYDSMAHEFHKISYACKKNVLPIYVSYGYDIGRYTTLSRLRGTELNLVWKIFTDTTYSYDDYLKYQVLKGKNVVLSGYSKMDNFYNHVIDVNRCKTRKKILISPHHTVAMDALPLSNFLKYYDLVYELPEIFPNIDFVFRPHPLLFTTLINNGIWTREETHRYIQGLKKRGIEYSEGGDYFRIFSECDAIINDCASFTVEWLYTGKPGCFVYSEYLKKKHLTSLMKAAISYYSVAHSRQDIIDFIREIDNANYYENSDMSQWVKDNIAINFPKVSEYIMNEIDILKD